MKRKKKKVMCFLLITVEEKLLYTMTIILPKNLLEILPENIKIKFNIKFMNLEMKN